MKETRILAMVILLLCLVARSEANWITTGNDMYSGVSGNVGIGTTSPKIKLDVRGDISLLTNDGTKGFRIQIRSDGDFGNGGSPDFNIRNFRTRANVFTIDEDTGNVGIGYVDPRQARLAVNGNVGIGTTRADVKLSVVDNSPNPVAFFDQNGEGWGIRVATSGEGSTPIFRAEAPQNKTAMTINANGRVGIGIINPNERLSVDGDVKASASFMRQTSGTLTEPIPWVGGSTIQAECEAYRVSSSPNTLFETLAQSYGYLAGVSGEGFLTDGIGVYGEVTSGLSGMGVYGKALVETGTGVYGVATGEQGKGVHGVSHSGGYGVKGEVTDGGYAFYGVSQGSGSVEPHYGGYFHGVGDYGCGIFAKAGIHGYAADLDGKVIVQNGNRYAHMCDIFHDDKGNSHKIGVQGETDTGYGVLGRSESGNGVRGTSPEGYGVYGYSKNGNGVRGSSPNGYAGAFFGKFRLADLPPIPLGLTLTWEGTTVGDGNVGYGVSSARFKENIEPLEDDFHKILKAEPKSFTAKGRDVKGIGFIAEEFDELGLDHLLIYEDGKPLSIRYELISLYLLEVLKEQTETTRQLKAEIESLKHSVNILEEQTKNERSVLVKAIQ